MKSFLRKYIRKIIEELYYPKLSEKINSENLFQFLTQLENGVNFSDKEILAMRNLLEDWIEKKHKEIDKIKNYKEWKKKTDIVNKKFFKYQRLLSKQKNSYGQCGDINASETYHFTDVNSAINIIEDNTFESLGDYEGLSTTTFAPFGEEQNYSSVRWYHGKNNIPEFFSDLPIRFDLNLKKLKKDGYEIIGGCEEIGTHRGEFEIKIIGNPEINNAKQYINQIVIYKNKLKKSVNKEFVNELINLLKEKNIKFLFK